MTALGSVPKVNQNKPHSEFVKTTTYKDFHKKNGNKSYWSHYQLSFQIIRKQAAKGSDLKLCSNTICVCSSFCIGFLCWTGSGSSSSLHTPAELHKKRPPTWAQLPRKRATLVHPNPPAPNGWQLETTENRGFGKAGPKLWVALKPTSAKLCSRAQCLSLNSQNLSPFHLKRNPNHTKSLKISLFMI